MKNKYNYYNNLLLPSSTDIQLNTISQPTGEKV